MKKLISIFIILFIMIIATGCNTRRNTIHFEPEKKEEIETQKKEGDKTDFKESKEEVEIKEEKKKESEKKISKKNVGPKKVEITSLDNGTLETNISYHVVRGNTPKETKSIKINDYILTKYAAGQTEWSYIASTGLNTLKEGENKYIVTALDENGRAISAAEFSINYEEASIPELPFVGTSAWISILLSTMASTLYFGIRKIKNY